MTAEAQILSLPAFTILKGPKGEKTIIGFGWERFVFPAMDIVYKHSKRDDVIYTGHKTGA
jgi:hypothetical protein